MSTRAIFGRDLGVGTISGMAPRARIAAYKACFGEAGCVVSDLVEAIDTAVADGVDVINYSIGSDTPSLLSPDAVAFLFAADAGVFVATSAGNAGPGAGTVGSPASAPWVTGGRREHARPRTSRQRSRSVTAPATRAAASPRGVGPAPPGRRRRGTAPTGLEPGADVASAPIVLCLRVTGIASVLPRLRRRGGRRRRDDPVRPTAGQRHADRQPRDSRPLHVAGAGWRGHRGVHRGCRRRSHGALTGGHKGATTRARPTWPCSRLAVRMARCRDIIKPDVTAPGVQILAGNSPDPVHRRPRSAVPGDPGHSMSSPHVAGVGALLVGEHPDWTPAMIRSALMTTGAQDVDKEDGTTPADPFDMGGGHIQPMPGERPGPRVRRRLRRLRRVPLRRRD